LSHILHICMHVGGPASGFHTESWNHCKCCDVSVSCTSHMLQGNTAKQRKQLCSSHRGITSGPEMRRSALWERPLQGSPSLRYVAPLPPTSPSEQRLVRPEGMDELQFQHSHATLAAGLGRSSDDHFSCAEAGLSQLHDVGQTRLRAPPINLLQRTSHR
jgi:hypothetical protein